jgi:alkylation response protein AidB-like acyl-CoA dehydrogenase
MIDLRLNDEQQAMVESVSALLTEQSPVARLRPAGARTDIHGQLAEWGWFGVGLPEAAGGLNLGPAGEALLYLEAGRFLLSPSILATTLAAKLVPADRRAQFLDGRQRAALVMMAGENVAYCFDRADAAVLVKIDLGEISLYPAEAFAGTRVAGLDETVVMEKGALDAKQRLASESGHRAGLLVAAMLAGIAKASCDLAVEYAKIREQFGQPIGAFQAIKHRCADMALNAFAAEAQLKMAAVWAAEEAESTAFQVAAAARTTITAALDNGASAIQVHGGMGFSAECDAHVYLKRAHLLSSVIGGLEKQDTWLLTCAAPEER